jgi:hypothetical protein
VSTRKPPIRFICLALLFAGIQGAAWAKEASKSRDWANPYLGGRLGYLEVEEVDEGDLNVGVVAGFPFHPQLALSIAVDFHEAEYDLESRETYALTGTLEAHLLAPRATVRPYGLVGIGYYYSAFEFEGPFGVHDVDLDGGFHTGFGVDIRIKCCEGEAGPVMLNLEARKIFTRAERHSAEVEPDGRQITLGVKFLITE